MSKGFGRVQREIDAIFRKNPDSSFTVEELCSQVYADYWEEGEVWRYVAKRQRVAVIRAAKVVTKRHSDIVIWTSEKRGGTLIFVNSRSVMSYATARLKSMFGTSDDDGRRSLREDERFAELIAPGGRWCCSVQEYAAMVQRPLTACAGGDHGAFDVSGGA